MLRNNYNNLQIRPMINNKTTRNRNNLKIYKIH